MALEAMASETDPVYHTMDQKAGDKSDLVSTAESALYVHHHHLDDPAYDAPVPVEKHLPYHRTLADPSKVFQPPGSLPGNQICPTYIVLHAIANMVMHAGFRCQCAIVH